MDKRPTHSTTPASAADRPQAVHLHPAATHPVGGDLDDSPLAQTRVEQQVQLGIDALRHRRWRDAAEYLTRAVAAEQGHAVAHNALGILYRAQGDLDASIASYRRALQSNPGYAEAHNNLGIAYESKGSNELAVASYRAALNCKPDFAAAYNNLGNALTKQGKYPEAIAAFQTALVHKPRFPEALNNRGLALRELGRPQEAEASFRRALELQPNFAEAFQNLGNILRDQRQLEAALECFELARQHKPGFAAAHVCCGNLLLDMGQPAQASAAFESALRVAPRSAEAWFGLASAQRDIGRHEESAESYRQAINCKPEYVEAYNNLGNALATQGDLQAAIDAFQQAVKIDPDYLPAHNNLGNLFRLQDRLEEAAQSYREVLLRRPSTRLDSLRISTLCPTVFRGAAEMEDYAEQALREWKNLEGACIYSELSELLSAANEPPYNLQFFSSNIRALKEAYASIFHYRGPEYVLRSAGDRLRIGFVVTAHHEIAFLRLIWDVFKRLDSDAFELTIVCTRRAADKFRSHAAAAGAHVLALPDRPDRAVETIRAAMFDVLYYFEICTDAVNYFLPFFRLAPVQCTSWGIQVTSGIPNVDYYLSNQLVEPPEAESHYSEALVRASTLLAYQTPIQRPSSGKTREAFGFSRQQNVYLCPQHLGKFHSDFDPLLGEILRGDPCGIVVITQDRYGYGARKLEERLRRTVPDVAPRVLLIARQNLPDYLSLVAAADVLLDPPHFTGVNTTYDALALDQPIVTCPSAFHRGRYTYGCYRKMGMDDCVASNGVDYVRIALQLGRDQDQRASVRQKISETKHRLFYDQSAVTEHARILRQAVMEARGR